jgi:hypothetical protein
VDKIRRMIEAKRGTTVTDEAWRFAVDQFEKNAAIRNIKKVYDETAYDMLDTNLDFYYRRLKGATK